MRPLADDLLDFDFDRGFRWRRLVSRRPSPGEVIANRLRNRHFSRTPLPGADEAAGQRRRVRDPAALNFLETDCVAHFSYPRSSSVGFVAVTSRNGTWATCVHIPDDDASFSSMRFSVARSSPVRG